MTNGSYQGIRIYIKVWWLQSKLYFLKENILSHLIVTPSERRENLCRNPPPPKDKAEDTGQKWKKTGGGEIGREGEWERDRMQLMTV